MNVMAVIWSAGRKHAEIIAKPNELFSVSPELGVKDFIIDCWSPMRRTGQASNGVHDGTFALSESSDLQYSRSSLEIHDFDGHYCNEQLCNYTQYMHVKRLSRVEAPVEKTRYLAS